MSRIGYAPITVPEGTEVTIADDNTVTVKGKLGMLEQKMHSDIKVKQEAQELKLERPTEQKRHKALHGLYRALLANMITGVSEGYKRELELVGIGYRVTAKGQTSFEKAQMLDFTLGYSHNIVFQLPKEVNATVVQERGQNPQLVLESFDKQLVGQVASKIRSLRAPEPYKGKGIRYKGEYIRRKEGKAAAAAT